MKKSYLMIAAVATLFVACAEKETFKEIDNNETELIGFYTYHGKATRAAINAPQDLTRDATTKEGGFGVYGYKHADNAYTLASNKISWAEDPDSTRIFDNVQVYYVGLNNPNDGFQGFKYDLPKYWDKSMTYVFFAYAPYANEKTTIVAGVSFDKTTGLFTRNDIKSYQQTNDTIQKLMSDGTTKRTQYTLTPDESRVTDYLIAPYVPNQKYDGTNQSGKQYSDTYKKKTVGFTFYHILSKLNVTVKVKDSEIKEQSGHKFAGVQDIQITKLNIENLPNDSTANGYVYYKQGTVTEGANATVPTATFSKNADGNVLNFDTNLNIVADDSNDSNVAADDKTNALTTSALYILDGGSVDNSGVITNPTDTISQRFHYFIAPNTLASNASHILNIDYAVTYVDGTVDKFVREINLSDASNLTSGSDEFGTMEQNNIYNITVIIDLEEILFTVDKVEEWVDNSTTETEIN